MELIVRLEELPMCVLFIHFTALFVGKSVHLIRLTNRYLIYVRKVLVPPTEWENRLLKPVLTNVHNCWV